MSLENKLTSDKILTISAEAYQQRLKDLKEQEQSNLGLPLYVGVHTQNISSDYTEFVVFSKGEYLDQFIGSCPKGAKEVIEYRINICSASSNAHGTQFFIAQSGIACLFGEARKAYENKIQTNQEK